MSEQRKMKSYEELEFKDNFMFKKVMEDEVLCSEVLECLLERKIEELGESQTQKELQHTSRSKPIYLDVMNITDSGEVFDTEMENLNHKKIEDHTLPKRSRYYQSSIDMEFLEKGDTYKKLPESNVVFICTFDPFQMEISQYSFRERCDQKPEMELGDGTRKYFFNCTYQGDDISKELRHFYDYVINGRAESELTKKIHAAVVKGRKNEIWRAQYMREWDYTKEVREEGREEGREEERINTERERKKAEQERERADRAERRVKELEAMLAEKSV